MTLKTNLHRIFVLYVFQPLLAHIVYCPQVVVANC